MSVLSKKTAISLACATALATLTAAPSFAGVIAPTDKANVTAESTLTDVHYRYGWCHHHHHHYWYPSYYYSYPYYGWGWGWGFPWIF